MSMLDQIVRLARGRDAKDVAFATIFGPARMLVISPDIGLLNRNAAVKKEKGKRKETHHQRRRCRVLTHHPMLFIQ